MPYTIGDIVHGKIQSLAFGGNGILKLPDGYVVFAPFTAPEDQVRVKLINVKKNYAIGQLISIETESPFRVVPKCPYFGACGGCQLQHLEYSEQLRYKMESVKDALRKFAGIEVNPFINPSEKVWAYRRHIYLQVRKGSEGFSAGYVAIDQKSLVKVECCPIFLASDDAALRDIQYFASRLLGEQDGKVMVVKRSRDKILLHFHFSKIPTNLFSEIEWAKKNFPRWEGVVVSAPGLFKTFGDIVLETELFGLKFRYSSSAFMQNHPDESIKIYEAIYQIVEESKAQKVLDLYCGIGISSLLLAKSLAFVMGIENNDEAIKLAKYNSKINGIKNALFLHANVEQALDRIKDKSPWEVVLVNPPREGLGKSVLEALLSLKPKEWIYVSCMPTTLARDLKQVLNAGYQIKRCQAFDMFPQTGHVETLVHLKLI